MTSPARDDAQVRELSPKMLRALQWACRWSGVYHEFSNTSTINALVKRRLIQSSSPPGWYIATDAGRAAVERATTEDSVGTKGEARSDPQNPTKRARQ